MTAIRISVTAEHIAAAGPIPATDTVLPIEHKTPIERAIADVFGQQVICDHDDTTEMATIGQRQTILVVELPAAANAWADSWWDGEPVEPFDFDIEIEDWLTALIVGSLERVS